MITSATRSTRSLILSGPSLLYQLIKLPITALRWSYHQVIQTRHLNIDSPIIYRIRHLNHGQASKELNEWISFNILQSRVTTDKGPDPFVSTNEQKLSKEIKKLERTLELPVYCLNESLEIILNEGETLFHQIMGQTSIKEAFDFIKNTKKVISPFFFLDKKDKDKLSLNDLLVTLSDLDSLKESILILSNSVACSAPLKEQMKQCLSFIKVCETHVDNYKCESLEYIDENVKERFDALFNALESFDTQEQNLNITNNKKTCKYTRILYSKICKAKDKMKTEDTDETSLAIFLDVYLSTNDKSCNIVNLLLGNYKSRTPLVSENPDEISYSNDIVKKLKDFHDCFKLRNSKVKFNPDGMKRLGRKLSELKEIPSFTSVLERPNCNEMTGFLIDLNPNSHRSEQESSYYLPMNKMQNLDPSIIISTVFDLSDESAELDESSVLMMIKGLISSLPINLYLTVSRFDDFLNVLDNYKEILSPSVFESIEEMKCALALWFIKDEEEASCRDLIELFNLKEKLSNFINILSPIHDIFGNYPQTYSDLPSTLSDFVKAMKLLISTIDIVSEIALAEVFDFSNIQKPAQTHLLKEQIEKTMLYLKSMSEQELDKATNHEVMNILSSINEEVDKFDSPSARQPRMIDHLEAKKRYKKIIELSKTLNESCKKDTPEFFDEEKIKALLSSSPLTQKQRKMMKEANIDLKKIKEIIIESEKKESKPENEQIINKLIKNATTITEILNKNFLKDDLYPCFELMCEWRLSRFKIDNFSESSSFDLYHLMSKYLFEMEVILNIESKVSYLKEQIHECFEHTERFAMQVYNNKEKDLSDQALMMNEKNILNELLPFEEVRALQALKARFLSEIIDDQNSTSTSTSRLLFNKNQENQENQLMNILKEISDLSLKMISSDDFIHLYPSFELLNSLLLLSRKCNQMNKLMKTTNLMLVTSNRRTFCEYSDALSKLYSKMDDFCEKELSSTLRGNLQDLREFQYDLSHLLRKQPNLLKTGIDKHPEIASPLLKLEDEKQMFLPQWIEPWKVNSANFFTEKEKMNDFDELKNKYKKAVLHFESIETLDEHSFIESPEEVGRLTEILLLSETVDEKELQGNPELLALKSKFELLFQSEDEPQEEASPEAPERRLKFTPDEIEIKVAKSNYFELNKFEIKDNYRTVNSRLNVIISLLKEDTGKNTEEDQLLAATNFTPLSINWVRRYVKFIRMITHKPHLKEKIPPSTLELFDTFYSLLEKRYESDFHINLLFEPDKYEFHS